MVGFLHNFKKHLAFSLVELMISLITISCIAAAFTPVITKRLSTNGGGNNSQTQVLSDCSQIEGSDSCSLCYPNECIVCERTCQPGWFLNIKKCICAQCSTGCKYCPDTSKCFTCDVGYYCTNADCTSCTKCPTGKTCPEGSTSSSQCQ